MGLLTMRTQIDCIPCFLRQTLDACRQVTTDQVAIEATMREVLAAAANFDYSKPPPAMGQIIHRVLRQHIGHPDPYLEVKKQSTEYALRFAPKAQSLIDASEQPFETAVRFAIAGNILDFAVCSDWDEGRIDNSLEGALEHQIDTEAVHDLQERISVAESVLILGDNAGETVFDRLLIECFPGQPKVTYAVKGSPVINDATLEDACHAGIDRVARLIHNGNDAPGTIIEQASPLLLDCFGNADVVIAKGQANFETLSVSTRSVDFLTQIKCPVIAERYGYDVGEWLVITSQDLRERAAAGLCSQNLPSTP